jgi:hypothetical protein
MFCPQCQINPKAHCFQQFAQKGDIRYFYTGNSKEVERIDTPEKIGYFISHVDQVRGTPWVWVIDCAGMKSREISSDFRKSLVNTISKEHSTTLHNIFFINTTTWMRIMITFLRPFIHRDLVNKLHFFKSSTELVYELNGAKVAFIPWLK